MSPNQIGNAMFAIHPTTAADRPTAGPEVRIRPARAGWLPALLVLLHVLLAWPAAGTAEPLHYTVQISSHQSLANARRLYHHLESALPDNFRAHLRIERIEPYYTIRLGKFADINSTTPLFDLIKKDFADAVVLLAHFRDERLIEPPGESAGNAPPVAAAGDHATVHATAAEEEQDQAAESTGTAEPAAVEEEPAATGAADPAMAAAGDDDEPIEEDSTTAEKSSPAAEPAAAPVGDDEPAAVQDERPPLPKAGPAPRTGPGQGLYLFIIGLVLALTAAAYLYKRQRRSSRPPDAAAGHYELRSPPGLTYAYKARLSANLKELAMVEGNISGLNKNVKTFYITSCLAAEGKTTAAVSIAYSLAMNSAANVLLIDGNPHAPQIHRLFGTRLSPGLTDLLQTDISANRVLQKTEYHNLAIITAGLLPADGPSPLRSPALPEKLEPLARDFDYVIVDGQALLTAADTALIANRFSGTLLVVECEKTKREVIALALAKAGKTGGRIMGVVLNKRRLYIPAGLYKRM